MLLDCLSCIATILLQVILSGLSYGSTVLQHVLLDCLIYVVIVLLLSGLSCFNCFLLVLHDEL